MIRKFTNIVCVYYNDKNNCPDLEIDDVILDLTTNKEQNYEKISEIIVDYAFALFCNKSDLKDFSQDYKKYKRQHWKLLDFREIIKTTEIKPKDQK